MEYVQERITTLHAFDEPAGIPADDLVETLRETAVVVPMTDRELESPAAAGVLAELEELSPATVVVPLRASEDRLAVVKEWLESYDLPIQVLWCNTPQVTQLLASVDLEPAPGKGRDVWLGLGVAADTASYVVVHDADAKSYDAAHVRRLVAPLTMGYAFTKGYYARVEDGQLYGRLCRLLYEPLLAAVAETERAPILEYLRSFRYGLAGEFAASAELVRQLRTPPTWGLEVGTLGEAFEYAGFTESAQVDLGYHRHEHRVVPGDDGLEGMSEAVAGTVLQVLTDRGVTVDAEALRERYRQVAYRFVDQYAADAAFNGLTFDPPAERDQIDRYARSIRSPEPVQRLPPWADTSLDPAAVREAAQPWRQGLETRADD